MNMSDSLHIILTGGTIEKSYDPLTEKPEFRHQSIIPDYLKTIVKAYPERIFETLFQIDSLEMDTDRRESIMQAVKRAESKKILIIHGTSTMPETARYLHENMKGTDKTVILTGAMIPLKEFAMSDAGFNLGYAMAQLEKNPPGIYLTMNARLFTPQEVIKNSGIGRFETV